MWLSDSFVLVVRKLPRAQGLQGIGEAEVLDRFICVFPKIRVPLFGCQIEENPLKGTPKQGSPIFGNPDVSLQALTRGFQGSDPSWMIQGSGGSLSKAFLPSSLNVQKLPMTCQARRERHSAGSFRPRGRAQRPRTAPAGREVPQ